MKIHLLKRVAGPNGNHGPGAIIDVAPDEARRLVDAHSAEYVEAMVPYRAPEPEPVATPQRETAVKSGVRRRRKAVEQ